LANFLPNLILDIQFVPILKKGKAGEIFIQLQELAEFVENVRIREEIAAPFWAMSLKRRLNFLKHIAQLLFYLSAHNGRSLPIQTVNNMGNMLVVFIEFELLQNLLNL